MILPGQQKIKTLNEIIKEALVVSLKSNCNNLCRVSFELKITRPRLKRLMSKFNIKVERNTRRKLETK